MTDIGDLVVRIQADASQLQSGMTAATSTVKQSADQMTSALNGVKSVLGTFGIALGAAEFVGFSKGALEAADNLYIMSQRTGIAASTLSALNIPLKQNGSSVDEFSSSMKFLSRNIELASEGNGTLIQRFSDLGLSVTKLKALTPEQQFYAIAAALSQVTDQSRFSADGLTLMGRGAAGLFPLIKQTNGNLAEFVQTQKDLGNALTDEEINKVHEYEDAWTSFVEHLKIKIVDATTSLHDFFDTLSQHNITNSGLFSFDPSQAMSTKMAADYQNWASGHRTREGGDTPPPLSTYTEPGYEPSRTSGGFSDGFTYDSSGNATTPKQQWQSNLSLDLNNRSAMGSNNDVAGGGAATTPAVKDASDQIDDYVQHLQDEADALSKSKLALQEYNAEQQLSNQIGRDLTDEEKERVDGVVDGLAAQKEAQDKVTEAQRKATEMAAQMDAQISGALADIIVNFKNLKTTITGVLDSIAKKIIEDQITTPLTKSLSSEAGGFLTNLFSGGDSASYTPEDPNSIDSAIGWATGDMQGYADGGDPPVGVPSIVGENGPELFVPKSAGTIIPNGAGGGSQITIQQNFNMSPGLQGTVEAEIRRAAPAIAGAAHDAVFASIQRGGREAKMVGRRS